MTESEIGYAAACLKIYLLAHLNGIARPFSDITAVLCEDGKTVLLELPCGDDEIYASFDLPAKVDEAAFDRVPYIEGFFADASQVGTH